MPTKGFTTDQQPTPERRSKGQRHTLTVLKGKSIRKQIMACETPAEVMQYWKRLKFMARRAASSKARQHDFAALKLYLQYLLDKPRTPPTEIKAQMESTHNVHLIEFRANLDEQLQHASAETRREVANILYRLGKKTVVENEPTRPE